MKSYPSLQQVAYEKPSRESLEKARRIIAEGDYPPSRMVKRVSLEGEESDGLIILGCGHLGKGRFGLAVRIRACNQGSTKPPSERSTTWEGA